MGYDLKKCLSGYLRGIFSGDGRTLTIDIAHYHKVSNISLSIS